MFLRPLLTLILTTGATTAVLHLAPAAQAQTCATPAPAPITGDPLTVSPDVPLVSRQTSIHWTRATRAARFGDGVVLEGQVVTDDGALPDARVDLYARPSGADAWARLDSTTTDSETGVFAFGCLVPQRNTTYLVVHEWTAFHGRSEGERQVAVSRRMPDALRQVGPSRFVYAGSVAPRYSGAVTLQRRDCTSCAWRVVARTPAVDDTRWKFRIDTSRLRGRFAYRAAIPADEHFAHRVADHVWRITVR